MSISINGSPSVMVETPRHHLLPSTPLKTNEPLSSSKADPVWISPALRHDVARAPHGEMMINAGAFSKLFDMLEQVFKTMREMVSVRNMTPALTTHSDKTPKHTPDMTTLLKAKAEPAKLPGTTPDLATQLKVKGEPGTTPRATSDTTNQLTVKVDKGTLQSVPVPRVNVSNDSNAQVKVELNIGNCHCPDTHVERDGGRVNPPSVPTPGVTPQPDAKVPPIRPEVRLNAHPVHRLDVTPRHDTKMPDNRATDTKLPDTKLPGTKVPDTKLPGTKVPDTKVPDAKVPDAKVPDTKVPDAKVPDTKVPDAKVPDAKVPDAKVPDTKVPDAKVPDTKAPDAKVTPPSKAKSSGIHPGALHRLESTPLPGTTPQSDTKAVTSTDNKQKDIPDQPKPEADVTSPGPAENETDFKGWAFINRRRLGN
ncbi:hypothetical protein FIV41_17925 [Pseudomonas marginalis]|uniref:Uncharacterized protein n=1 Tax=Pseudomonas marginalis TaxID=298 RepID=A0A9X9BQC8_PSEMA|nr:hypothetical protein [Pseudomonas marginalis]TWR58107.1 hypothetical protein FIV41_17925 [Pseudomonas marginalis]SEC91341.1 hypothetical protein SAMN04490193_4002 [Pseudomonas marginalis]